MLEAAQKQPASATSSMEYGFSGIVFRQGDEAFLRDLDGKGITGYD
jgi:hypothetical protein